MTSVFHVTINHYTECFGLTESPRVSWRIRTDRNDVTQTAYWIEVFDDADCRNGIWRSGMVTSGVSQNNEMPGISLLPAKAYWLRVRVEVNGSEESPWSSPFAFSTGLAEWQAQFVTAETPPCPASSGGTCVKGMFRVDGEVREAWLFTTALGIYVPFLNGQRVGSDLLSPGWTDYHKHLLYQTNDVTKLLTPGENCMGALLGAGWYKGEMGFLGLRNNYGDQTYFLCQLMIRYADGRVQCEGSNSGWIGCASAVTFSEIYHGEHYDARKEKDFWNHEKQGWHEVATRQPDAGVLFSQPGCRVRCEEKIPAQRIFRTPKGELVVDFGLNLTGWPEVRLRGEKDRTYMLRCFETLDAQGNVYTANLRSARQQLCYTAAETKNITYHPEFTFYGFRYLYLQDWPRDAVQEDFCAWVIHSRMEPSGQFTCSEPLLNQLHRNICRSLKGNFLDVPTDCPQRNERMGWTGDAEIFCATAARLMDVYPFYRKWLKDVRADQTAEGGVPHVVPDIISGKAQVSGDWLLSQGTHSASGWADAITICPWSLYLAYGDQQILRENYDAMKAWIGFMRKHSKGHIWNYMLQFGDWVALDAARGSYFGATPNDLTCTAYYANSVHIAAQTAEVLGYMEDAALFKDLYRQIKDAFRERFFLPDGSLTSQTQTAHILVLHFDLVPEEWREKTAARLVELLEKENGHLVTGFMGTPYFTEALAENGYPANAYDLLLKKDFPSWLFQVTMGATTVWEHWDGIRPDGTMWSPDMNSLNHYAYGSIGEWLYGGVCGIRVDPKDPGYHHALLRPRVTDRLSFASATLNTPYGALSLGWERTDNGRVRVKVSIPANTSAELYLEKAAAEQSLPQEQTPDGVRLHLPSGQHEFEYSV